MIHMPCVKAAPFHPVYFHLICYTRVYLHDFNFLQVEECILVLYIGDHTADFNIEALDLLMCMLKLEMVIYHYMAGSVCPWAVMNILVRIP